ncbi:MAG: hypothetical protein KDA67_01110 [Rhodobacteraceae bacterium]|nr:hypothetical protein [Paracoccaceae bacterium]
MQTGTYISGFGHLVLIGWAIIGGSLFSPDNKDEFQVADVTVISETAFAALVSNAPRAETEVNQPEQPDEVATLPDASRNVDKPKQTPPDVPDKPQDPGSSPDLSAARSTPKSEAQVDVKDLADQSTTDQQGASLVLPNARVADQDRKGIRQPDKLAILDAREQPAPRVDSTPAPVPPTDAEKARNIEKATEPDAKADKASEEKTEKAPDQASTEIVTEANKADKTSAPVRSRRPEGRPARLAEKTESQASDIEKALAEAQAEQKAASNGEGTKTPVAPSGPPLTKGEEEGLRLAVQECWNINPSSESARVTVTLAFSMEQNGMPQVGTIKMISSSGGSPAAVQSAFEAAKRAVIRCAKDGYQLPVDKYDRWRNIEIKFNPEQMRR